MVRVLHPARVCLAWVPVACVVAAGCGPRTDQAAERAAEPAPGIQLSDPLPVDPDVRQGVLDNGLHWYVEVNRRPEARAVLRLAVDAGSVLEDDDQRGVAHFVEHMAFNGTTHFPGTELVAYLESVGTQFGPHLNAHTSFDETVYKLTVPTDDPEVFDTAFTVLADWAGGLTFDEEEIAKERGVVLEEWRTGGGAAERITDRTLPLTYFGSPYAERRPIGTEASLRTFEPDAARRFYDDWYRPDLMAVIVVGDVDPDLVEAKIEDRFAGLPPAGEEARPRVRPDIPAHADTKVAIVTDPEVPRTTVGILAKADMPKGKTYADYRQSLLEGLALAAINERLAEIAKGPQAPFLGAVVGRQRLSPTEGGWSAGAAVAQGGAVIGYEALLVEIERLREHGVREGELDRARASTLAFYEGLLQEVQTTSSVQHAEELVRVFLTDEAMPGTSHEVALAKRFVPEITKGEVDAWLRDAWMPDGSRVVTVIRPPGAELTKADLEAVQAAVAAREIPPPPAEEASGELLAAPPTPGKVVETDETHADDLGFTGWTLSNGVQVWLRRTDFQQDEVMLAGFRAGGHSRVSDADYVSAVLAPEIAARSGFGGLDSTGLQRWAAGKRAFVSASLSEIYDLVSLQASVRDLEPALELLHATFVAPRFTEEGAALTLRDQRERLRNRALDPSTHFYDAYPRLVWPDDPRRQPWTLDTLDRLELAVAERVYAAHFGDAAGWTFVAMGNLPEDFQGLVERYLGSLPAGGEAPAWVDRGVRPAKGVLVEHLEKGADPRAQVRLELHGPFTPNDWVRRAHLFAVADILSVRLRTRLREELSGVYGVSVQPREQHLPFDHYAISILFTCDPERVDELVREARAVIASLREEGPSAAEVAQEQALNRRGREDAVRSNGFWLSAFSGALKRQADPKGILGFEERNEALTPESVGKAAQALLSGPDRLEIVRVPEGSAPR